MAACAPQGPEEATFEGPRAIRCGNVWVPEGPDLAVGHEQALSNGWVQEARGACPAIGGSSLPEHYGLGPPTKTAGAVVEVLSQNGLSQNGYGLGT